MTTHGGASPAVRTGGRGSGILLDAAWPEERMDDPLIIIVEVRLVQPYNPDYAL